MAQHTTPDPDVQQDDWEVDVDEFEDRPVLNIADTADSREPRLLVQAGPGGYQLDAYWQKDDRKHQSNNWVTFHDQPHDYPHDNRHARDVEVGVEERDGESTIVIHDPDPRAANAGYGGADILVQFRSEGFYVELQWEDEQTDSRRYGVVVPFVDPRINREVALSFMEPEVAE